MRIVSSVERERARMGRRRRRVERRWPRREIRMTDYGL